MSLSRAAHSFFANFMTLRQFMTRRSLTWLGGCSLAILVPVAWFTAPVLPEVASSSTVEAVSSNGQRYLPVITARLDMAGPACLTETFAGVLKPKRASQLAAKTIGRVDNVLVEMGDSVSAGQMLIQLDHETLDADRQAVSARLASAEAQLAELRAGPRQEDIDQAVARVAELTAALRLEEAILQRTQRLLTTSAISQQEYDSIRYGVDMAKAQRTSAEHALAELKAGTRVEQVQAAVASVRALQAELQRLDVQIEEQAIRAPFDGSIQARLVDEGAVVSPGQALVQIVESGELEVHVGLPIELTAELSAADLEVAAGNLKLPCTIDRMSPAVNEATRTRDIVLKLNDPPGSLVLGAAVDVVVRRACNIRSQSSPKETFWVPRDALNTAARGLWAVMIAHPQDEASGLYAAERRQVELVRAQGDWAEIRGPIKAEEHLIVEGTHRLVPGQVVVLSDKDS